MSSHEEPSTSASAKRKKYLRFYRVINITSRKDPLRKHNSSKAHSISSKNIKSQPKISSFIVTKTQKADIQVKQGEVRFASFGAEHNLPFAIMEHLLKLMQPICPASKIAEKLKCSMMKTHAMIDHIIGKESFDNLCEDLRQTKFSFIIDESTDLSTTKHLCLVVRYAKDHRVRHYLLAKFSIF